MSPYDGFSPSAGMNADNSCGYYRQKTEYQRMLEAWEAEQEFLPPIKLMLGRSENPSYPGPRPRRIFAWRRRIDNGGK